MSTIAISPLNTEILTYRTERNLARVTLAGGLSFAGGCVSGFVPSIAGITAGGIISGVGNGVSTWLAWEKKKDHLLESRIITDFPKLAKKVTDLNSLIDRVNVTYSDTINEPLQIPLSKPSHPWFWATKDRRNFVRVFVAGALSAAGGWLGGFAPTTEGIILGSFLGGIGNAVSTWLAFEQVNDDLIETSAKELLPKLQQIVKDSEAQLTILMDRVKALGITLLPPIEQATEDPTSLPPQCLKTRNQRNFVYVNTAGWLSAAGGWISGFVPDTSGILVGGAVGAAANSISTWLAWEKETDKEIERTVLHDFPKVILKIAMLTQRIQTLTEKLNDQEFTA